MSTSSSPLKKLVTVIVAALVPCVAIAVLLGIFGLLAKLFGHG
ncbi:hypothetical protein [Paraburkholderia sejongensis]|nr:hypothetical protein [Paraburkholderia sp. MMS20-SJTR3]